jgi:NAD(P)-dependent dehydrogenase (short-subunit alcohol dehydrogenase family)
MLEDKVIAIIGGTSGIGRALSIGLAEQGAQVFPASRSMDKVEETVAAVQAVGGSATGHEVDVLDPDSIDRFAAFVNSTAGRVDGLVNCAGITVRAPAIEVKLDDWTRVIEVNLRGTFLACQSFGRIMIAQGSGRIVNIGSMSAYVSIRDVAPYCASKGGVKMLTKALASEWAEHGVAVNTVHPGFFITELNKSVISEGMPRRLLIDQGTPMGRVGEVEELVGAAAFLLSEAAGFITGTDLVVDGGYLANGV